MPASSARPPQRRTLALTGATGFIGGALASRFTAAGWQVKALVRDPSRASALAKLGVQLVPGDLSNPTALNQLLSGCSALAHCAGAVRGFNRQDFDKVNVTGVKNLVQAAERQPTPPRLLSLSSLAAREPQLSPYAASKRAGEEALAACAERVRWIALRPPAVYGPGDREMLPLLRWLMRGIAPVLGSADARLSFLYVDDLVGAIERYLSLETCPNGIFTLHDGHPQGYSWDEIVAIAAALRGRRVIPLRFPRPLLRGLASLSLTWAKVTRRAPMLSPGKYRELTHRDWVCDNQAFSQASGWQPRVQFPEGLELTLAADAHPQ